MLWELVQVRTNDVQIWNEGMYSEREKENGASWKNTEAGEKEERCATKQNLSGSLSSAIAVETSLFLVPHPPPPIFSLFHLERGNQSKWER